MSILKQAKLVVGHKKGRWMYYRLPGKSAPPIVRQPLSWVRQATSDDNRILLDAEQMKKFLETKRELICEQQSLRRKQPVSGQEPAAAV